MARLPHSAYRRLGPLVPFGACFVVVWGMIGLERSVRWGEVLAALLLQLLVAAGLWWRDRWEPNRVATLVGLAVFLVSVALLRDGVGRVVGGYGTLVLLPVIWAALRNRRLELVLAVVGAAAVQLGPLVVASGPYYPSSGWRGGALLIVIAGVLGATVLTLVERVTSSERLHRLLAENSSDLVMRCSREGVIRYASPASTALLGYAPKDLVGMTIPELTHPDDVIGREEHLALIDASPHGGTRLARMRHRDGRWLWLEATVRPLRDAGGGVVERQAAFRDVTERVQREEEQRALSRIATLVASGADPHAVFDAVAEQVARLFDATVGAVVRFDAVGDAGDAGDGDVVGVWTVPGCDPPDHALDLAAPVTVSGERWGAVGASFSDAAVPDGLGERLARFADLVSVAISNAQTLEELARQATTDAVTGLANHRQFHERLREEVERALRYDHGLTLAMIDIDHFKRVNDTHGHQTGDLVLAAVAQELATQARTGDLVARVGGEEFAWLMPDTDVDGGRAATDRAREAISSLTLERGVSITVSAGVCGFGPDLDAGALVRCADQALYAAKHAGRDRTTAYGDLRAPQRRAA
jgi:diguanylate cyclase (GGDEF)-like protein/PAS domain S-box-containing protein